MSNKNEIVEGNINEVTHVVDNKYWIRELRKPFIPGTEEDYQTALYEHQHELSQPSKYIRRGDGDIWKQGQYLTEGKDFEIVDGADKYPFAIIKTSQQ